MLFPNDRLSSSLRPVMPLVGRPKKILLVEDDEYFQLVFDHILFTFEPTAQIDRVASGEEALEILRNGSATQPFDYDLIVADIFLSGKSTGLDLLHAMETRNPRIPLVITSSMPFERFLRAIGTDIVCPPYLGKPFSTGECRSLLEGLLQYGDED